MLILAIYATYAYLDQGWARICPGLEAAIKENRVQQAKADRSTALYARAEIVRAVLKTYKQNLLPVVWRQIPSFIDVCAFSPFKDILELPTENSVTEASFSDAVNELRFLLLTGNSEGKLTYGPWLRLRKLEE